MCYFAAGSYERGSSGGSCEGGSSEGSSGLSERGSIDFSNERGLLCRCVYNSNREVDVVVVSIQTFFPGDSG